jgi:hypothetical protein
MFLAEIWQWFDLIKISHFVRDDRLLVRCQFDPFGRLGINSARNLFQSSDPWRILNEGGTLCSLRHALCDHLFDRFIDQAVVERLRHVVLLGFWMVDELERIGHRFLGGSERLRESLSKVFDASL